MIDWLLEENGHLTNRDTDKAEMFNAFFASTFNSNDRLRGPSALSWKTMAVRMINSQSTLNLCGIYCSSWTPLSLWGLMGLIREYSTV